MSHILVERANVSSDRTQLIIVKAGPHRVLIPLENVSETMRPLPLQLLREAPAFVRGMSVIRGSSVAVVDLGALLGRIELAPPIFQRFLCLQFAGRTVALAVDAVVHIVEYSAEQIMSLPPLFEQAASSVVEGLCLVDTELYMLLSSSKLLDATAVTQESAAP